MPLTLDEESSLRMSLPLDKERSVRHTTSDGRNLRRTVSSLRMSTTLDEEPSGRYITANGKFSHP
jgi:hypothetical protein